MSTDKYNDDCPGCRPALVNVKTGQKMPDDSPEMVAVLRVWDKTTRIEREAFHRFTCLNSRAIEDLDIIQALSKRFEKAMP